MLTIQERALDLFDQRGFESVTIEEIANAADVSPSSVYRYFGTKEGIVVADEFDHMSKETLEGLLDVEDPVGSLLRLVREYESSASAQQEPHRRVRYIFQEPSIRRTACATLDEASRRLMPLFAATAASPAQARVASNALVFGYFGALEQWYTDGCARPIADYVEDGLGFLRKLWEH